MSKRGKSKIGPTYGLKDSFKEFKKTQCKNIKEDINYTLYKKICAEFNKKIIEEILIHSGTFKIPYKLGELRIQKRKMSFKDKNKLKIDWKSTNELGYTVYHMNDHSNNYRYKWLWTKRYAIVKNKSAYSFTATRTNMRSLANILLTNKQIDYFE